MCCSLSPPAQARSPLDTSKIAMRSSELSCCTCDLGLGTFSTDRSEEQLGRLMAKYAKYDKLGRVGAALFVLGGFWWLLVGADPHGWLVGVPAVAVAVASVLTLPSAGPAGLRVVALARLLGAFSRDSIRGAVDVGARSIARDPGLRPVVVRWQTRLRSPFARLVFLHTISLVPGTLSARAEGAELLVHLLDKDSAWRDELTALEGRVAAAVEPDGSGQR